MITGPETPEGREARLAEILADYLDQPAVGALDTPAGLVARYPEFAEDLTEFFATREQLESAVRPLREALTGPDRSARSPGDEIGRLGDFRLIRQVGRGGMGIVYEAEQISLGRRVALKVLPFAATLDPRQLQRFKNEALAAAALDHPHVVDVYGVGCERATHYYAMRFVEGHSLAAVIEQLCRLDRAAGRALPGSVGRAFSTDAPISGDTTALAAVEGSTRRSSFPRTYFQSVAEVGQHVAQALEHAHQQGVIHRDIKPSNLLLDAQGKVWVADFGLARLEAAESLTGSGNLVGTLRYMAPEQALGLGPADHRGDVYGLGVTLYELLTLRPAFPGSDREDLLRQIATVEPPAPYRLDPAIPPDLETVILKAMAKDPAERYPTAGAVADDLRRFLEDRPVLARPPGPIARLRRWVRRHRPAVLTVGVALIVLLVLGVAALAISNVLIDRERAESERRRAEAVANFEKARAAVDRMTRVAQEQLADAPHMEQVRQELLQDALRFYQEFLTERGGDPAFRQDAALAYGRLGNLERYLGRTAEAEQNLRRAIELLEAEPALRPDARASLGEFYYSLGWMLESQGRRTETVRVFERSAAVLERLTAEFPAEPEYRERLANSYISQANSVLSNRPGEAESLLRRVIGDSEADHAGSHGHALAQAALGSLLARTGRPDEAERTYRRALEIEEGCTAHVARRPGNRNRVGCLFLNLGSLLRNTGRPEEAEQNYRRAITTYQQLTADFPAVPYFRANLAGAHANLGELLTAGGRARYADAEAAYRSALAQYQSLRAEYPAQPAYGRALLGNQIQLVQILLRTGRADESRETVGQAATLRGALDPVDPGALGYLPGVTRSYLDLGHLLSLENRKSEATEAYRAGVAVQEKAEVQLAGGDEARRELARSHLDAARALHSAEQIADEEKLCRWAVAHYQKLLEGAPDRMEDRNGLARASLALGTVLRKAGRLADAEKASRQAVDHFARPDPTPEHRRGMASAYNLLGAILREDGRPGAAEPALEKSVDLWAKLAAEFPEQRPLRQQEANARNNLGYLLTDTGRPAKAEPLHRRALELFEGLAAEDGTSGSYRDGQGMSYAGLSAVHAAAGRLEEAVDARRRSVALYRELVKVNPAPWYQFKLAEEVGNLGIQMSAAGRPADAVPALEEALTIEEKLNAEWPKVPRYPQSVAQTQNNLAWLLATCPVAKIRDPRRAADLAERAVESAPKQAGFWNTLGVARYRAGDPKAAVEALRKSMDLARGGTPFDWFFLAMAHRELGQSADAREWYDRAVAWMDANKERLARDKLASQELRRFCAEAEQVLGLKTGR